MLEVLTESIRYVNLPFTVLLGVVVLYWLFVMLGALDLSTGGDADADAHHEGGGSGWFGHVLHFINVGEVPVMLVASVMILCLWIGSLMTNYYFAGDSVLLACAFLVPNLVLSLIVTRYVTLPLRPLFRYLMKEHGEERIVVGQTCQIITSEATETFGQAQIDTSGAPLLINVRTIDGSALPKGAPQLSSVRTRSAAYTSSQTFRSHSFTPNKPVTNQYDYHSHPCFHRCRIRHRRSRARADHYRRHLLHPYLLSQSGAGPRPRAQRHRRHRVSFSGMVVLPVITRSSSWISP
jgi:hypothetical protein